MRRIVERINSYCKKNNLTAADLYKSLDYDGNGMLEKNEFVDILPSMFTSYKDNVSKIDASKVFDAIDTDDNGAISLNEFSLYFEGIVRSRQERSDNIS